MRTGVALLYLFTCMADMCWCNSTNTSQCAVIQEKTCWPGWMDWSVSLIPPRPCPPCSDHSSPSLFPCGQTPVVFLWDPLLLFVNSGSRCKEHKGKHPKIRKVHHAFLRMGIPLPSESMWNQLPLHILSLSPSLFMLIEIGTELGILYSCLHVHHSSHMHMSINSRILFRNSESHHFKNKVFPSRKLLRRWYAILGLVLPGWASIEKKSISSSRRTTASKMLGVGSPDLRREMQCQGVPGLASGACLCLLRGDELQSFLQQGYHIFRKSSGEPLPP